MWLRIFLGSGNFKIAWDPAMPDDQVGGGLHTLRIDLRFAATRRVNRIEPALKLAAVLIDVVTRLTLHSVEVLNCLPINRF